MRSAHKHRVASYKGTQKRGQIRLIMYDACFLHTSATNVQETKQRRMTDTLETSTSRVSWSRVDGPALADGTSHLRLRGAAARLADQRRAGSALARLATFLVSPEHAGVVDDVASGRGTLGPRNVVVAHAGLAPVVPRSHRARAGSLHLRTGIH